jgi:hypothetical protein
MRLVVGGNPTDLHPERAVAPAERLDTLPAAVVELHAASDARLR